MVNTNTEWVSLSDKTIIFYIGEYIKHQRLVQNKTQVKIAEIIVYCSIGYRSEKIAEKMKSTGFTDVKNLYGGIFDWYNSGKQVLDSLVC